jgi:hypothetical protein
MAPRAGEKRTDQLPISLLALERAYGDHQQKTVSIIINSEGKVMAKGQKRSNREPKKPKRPKQKTSPASSSAAQTKAVAGDRGKRK